MGVTVLCMFLTFILFFIVTPFTVVFAGAYASRHAPTRKQRRAALLCGGLVFLMFGLALLFFLPANAKAHITFNN